MSMLLSTFCRKLPFVDVKAVNFFFQFRGSTRFKLNLRIYKRCRSFSIAFAKSPFRAFPGPPVAPLPQCSDHFLNLALQRSPSGGVARRYYDFGGILSLCVVCSIQVACFTSITY